MRRIKIAAVSSQLIGQSRFRSFSPPDYLGDLGRLQVQLRRKIAWLRQARAMARCAKDAVVAEEKRLAQLEANDEMHILVRSES